MTATVTTLNATRATIEGRLMAGASVQQVARDLTEPAANVYAIYRDLKARGLVEDKGEPPPPPATRPTAVNSTAVTSTYVAVPAPAVDTLIAAAGRSTSKRTQALGVKLADLADVVRARLADERHAAEATEARRVEQEKARAEVTRLERQLAAARQKLGKKPSGVSTAKTIREWARDSGVDCPPVGIIPRRVADAYHKGHPGGAA